MLSRKVTTREKVLLLILVLLLVGELYYLLVQQRVQRELAEAHSRIENATISYNTESARAAKKEEMLKKVRKAGKDDSIHPLPDYDNSANVVAYLNGVMASTEEYELVFNTVEASDYIAMRSINMSFICPGYSEARDIIAQLENGPYYCEVTGLSMSTESGNSDMKGKSVFVQMTAVFYEYVEAGTDIEETEETAG